MEATAIVTNGNMGIEARIELRISKIAKVASCRKNATDPLTKPEYFVELNEIWLLVNECISFLHSCQAMMIRFSSCIQK